MNRSAGRTRGFTLLEVLITVGIVAILAAIALPFYADTIRRGKLVDVAVRLGDFRSQQEKWFLDNRTYQAVPAAGTNCGIPNPPPAAADPFEIICTAPTATTYSVVATGRPAGGMDAGFVYTVNQANQRSSTGALGWTSNASCWAVRKDGSCQ
jgi:type IV pilus assembly protein PilE